MTRPLWRTMCAATGRVQVAHAVRRYGATEQILFNFQFPCISAIWLQTGFDRVKTDRFFSGRFCAYLWIYIRVGSGSPSPWTMQRNSQP